MESDDGVRASDGPFHAREALGGDVVRQTALSAHGRPSAAMPCVKQPFPRTGGLRRLCRASNSPFHARETFGGVVRASNSPFRAREDLGDDVVRQTAHSAHGSPWAAMSCVKQPFPRTGGLRRLCRASNGPFHARETFGGVVRASNSPFCAREALGEGLPELVLSAALMIFSAEMRAG